MYVAARQFNQKLSDFKPKSFYYLIVSVGHEFGQTWGQLTSVTQCLGPWLGRLEAGGDLVPGKDLITWDWSHLEASSSPIWQVMQGPCLVSWPNTSPLSMWSLLPHRIEPGFQEGLSPDNEQELYNL
jgi:hypothetical protein